MEEKCFENNLKKQNMSEKESKICSVCGDRAVARNFSAFTCESCKVFFRRNATQVEKFKCFYGNKCEINLNTRKKCRKCRIEKCFKVGMIKEWILSEEEKKYRTQVIEENRKKRLQDQNFNKEVSPLNTDIRVDPILSEILDETNPLISDKFDEILNELNECLKCSETELCPVIPRQITDYNNNLTESEGSVFTELLNATKSLTISIPGNTSEISTYLEAMEYMAKRFDEEIRKLVKTAKCLNAFKDICSEDQEILFKQGVIEMILVRNQFIYDQDNESLTLIWDQNNSMKLNLQVFKQYKLEDYVYGKYCIEKLIKLSDWDETIVHLVMVIVLFMPTRPQLKQKSQIRLKQQIYIHLLKRYLQLKYRSETESKSRLSKLIEYISDLHFFHEKSVRGYFESMPSDYISFKISPILKEIYNKN